MRAYISKINDASAMLSGIVLRGPVSIAKASALLAEVYAMKAFSYGDSGANYQKLADSILSTISMYSDGTGKVSSGASFLAFYASTIQAKIV